VNDVQVAGLKELDAALTEIPAALRRNVVLSALRRAARPIVRDARMRARRGTDPRRRGSMKQRKSGESLTMGPGADSIAARAVKSSVATEAAVTVGPDRRHWYMKFLEFGSARQAPERFLTPAFEVNKEAAVQLAGEELWKSIAATARRLARQAEAGTLGRRASEALRS
jgi:HK97 gp10 family phage protein